MALGRAEAREQLVPLLEQALKLARKAKRSPQYEDAGRVIRKAYSVARVASGKPLGAGKK